jgi:hypothetical protein
MWCSAVNSNDDYYTIEVTFMHSLNVTNAIREYKNKYIESIAVKVVAKRRLDIKSAFFSGEEDRGPSTLRRQLHSQVKSDSRSSMRISPVSSITEVRIAFILIVIDID